MRDISPTDEQTHSKQYILPPTIRKPFPARGSSGMHPTNMPASTEVMSAIKHVNSMKGGLQMTVDHEGSRISKSNGTCSTALEPLECSRDSRELLHGVPEPPEGATCSGTCPVFLMRVPGEIHTRVIPRTVWREPWSSTSPSIPGLVRTLPGKPSRSERSRSFPRAGSRPAATPRGDTI
jgi:hypothetical protein